MSAVPTVTPLLEPGLRAQAGQYAMRVGHREDTREHDKPQNMTTKPSNKKSCNPETRKPAR
jgi:hypothetical protein